MSGAPDPKPTRGGKMRVCAAEGCESEFYAPPIALRRGQGRFCSRACAYRSRPTPTPETVERRRQAMLALNRSGERNPNFRHGLRTGLQIRGFTVQAKGETCCRSCGRTDTRLHLHHAVPRSICPPEARRDLRNGIALCASCHISWHRGGRVVLHRELFRQDEWAFISGLTLTGRETAAWLDKHYPPLGESGMERLFGVGRS